MKRIMTTMAAALTACAMVHGGTFYMSNTAFVETLYGVSAADTTDDLSTKGSNVVTGIVGGILSTSIPPTPTSVSFATNSTYAVTVTGPQSNAIASAVQPATLSLYPTFGDTTNILTVFLGINAYATQGWVTGQLGGYYTTGNTSGYINAGQGTGIALAVIAPYTNTIALSLTNAADFDPAGTADVVRAIATNALAVANGANSAATNALAVANAALPATNGVAYGTFNIYDSFEAETCTVSAILTTLNFSWSAFPGGDIHLSPRAGGANIAMLTDSASNMSGCPSGADPIGSTTSNAVAIASISNAVLGAWVPANVANGVLTLDWAASAFYSFAPTNAAFSVTTTNQPSTPRWMELQFTTPSNSVPTVSWPAGVTWTAQIEITSNMVYLIALKYLGGSTFLAVPVGGVNAPL